MNMDIEKQLFGSVERRLFRFTAVLFSSVLLAGLVGAIVWILAQTLAVFYNLLLPLSVAGILALVLYPIVNFLQNRLRLPRLVAISALFVGFFAALVGFAFLVVPMVVDQAAELVDAVPKILANWQETMGRYFPDLSATLSARLEWGDLDVLLPNLDTTGKTILSYLGLLVGLGFVPLFLFFTLLSGGKLRAQATEILSIFNTRTQEKVLHLMDIFVAYVTTFFQGQLIIAMIMGTLYAVGFTLIGLKAAILIGMFLGLLNIVPYLGTLIGLLVVLPMAYFQPEGDIQLLALVLLVFAVVQLLESWLLTPKIMADRSGLHPALVVISIFFWGIALNGIIGMILAVPLTAFTVALWSETKASLSHSFDTREEERST